MVTPTIWLVTVVLILGLMAFDYVFHVRAAHTPTIREAARWTSIYVSLAVAFGIAVWFFGGSKMGLEYFAGYITELSLSVDNLFVFLIIMSSFRVPREHQQKVLMFGAGTSKVQVRYKNRYGRTRAYQATFEGAVTWIKRRHADTESDSQREQFEGYMREVACPACEGARLKPFTLAVTIDGRSINEFSSISIKDAAVAFGAIELSERDKLIAERCSRRSTPASGSCSTSG